MPRLVGPAERELTPVQRAILDFVLDYTRRSRYSPSYLEIGAAVRLKSSSAVRRRGIMAIERLPDLIREDGASKRRYTAWPGAVCRRNSFVRRCCRARESSVCLTLRWLESQ